MAEFVKGDGEIKRGDRQNSGNHPIAITPTITPKSENRVFATDIFSSNCNLKSFLGWGGDRLGT